MAKTYTEQEVFEKFRLQRPMTAAELAARPKDRYFQGTQQEWFDQRTAVYKLCEICGQPFCINNWDDKKPRTPKFKDFVICGGCDPRPLGQRYLKQGYTIVYRDRLRVVQIAQVTRALARRACLRLNPTDDDCRCASCTARKLFPEETDG